jgi:hypothetical protein
MQASYINKISCEVNKMPHKGAFLSVKIFEKLFDLTEKLLILHRLKMSDGVTGNTSDFGSEESRFET